MTQENWVNVKDYEGHYMVSDLGRVKSLPRLAWNGYLWHKIPGKILKQRYNKRNYAEVTFWLNGKKRDFMVHFLVCSSFNGVRPNNTYEVDHIDGNPMNNKAKNLRWVTHMENMHNPVSRKRFEAASKRIQKPVCQYTKDGNLVNVFESITDAAIKTGINLGNIGSCVSGNIKHHTAGGYMWKYAK